MNWEVWCNGKLIAQFVLEQDAEAFLQDSKERYSDCKFKLREVI